MPYIILPVVLSAVSSRLRPLPISFQSFGSFSFTSAGGSILAAASATLPKVVVRPEGVCVTTLLAAVHSEAGTFHSLAAAWTSITRAVAPPLRTYSCEARMPRLPPVEKSPQARLRATFWPGVGYSVVTFDQSHSSSSATSWARPVSVPWPISDRAMRITTVSSGRITTQAFTSGEPSAARTMAGPPKGMSRPSARPEPSAALPMTKARRLRRGGIWFMMISSSSVRGGVDRLAHLLKGAAAADIGNGVVDILVGRPGIVLQQRRHRHDHAALAITALRNIVVDPGLLNLVQG